MGLLSKPKAPAAPDPTATAQKQSQMSQDNAQWSANQYMQNAGKSGPFGSVSFGPGGGQSQSFDPSLQGGVQNITGAFMNQTGGLPTGFNFDMTTPENIAAGNYGAYSALTAPGRQQMQDQMKTTLAERGIPLGSEIEGNLSGNMNRQFALADTSAAANAWNAVPGMQAQMTNTAIQQGMAPGQLAGQSIGLLGGMGGLLPGYNAAPQFNPMDPGQTFASTTNNNYNQAMAKYNADMASRNALIGSSVGLLGNMFMPGLSSAASSIFGSTPSQLPWQQVGYNNPNSVPGLPTHGPGTTSLFNGVKDTSYGYM